MLSKQGPLSLYEQLYRFLRDDILSGRLSPGEKLPSKRALAENLGVSSITVESAYGRLTDEGYVWPEAKRGYYVAELGLHAADSLPGGTDRAQDSVGSLPALSAEPPKPFSLDLSSSRGLLERFPFSVWTRLLRETISGSGDLLLSPCPCGGVRPLREAIAGHLSSFRGMRVDPDQILVGAGTEYLYGLLLQLLGRDRVYCLEDPGYVKIAQIYHANGADCRWVPLDGSGIRIDALEDAGADVVHISPTHHFPTGITVPVGRRYELLRWASAKPGRYIIEDDYDSEFRLTGRPIPSLQSMDTEGRVIYMNTFSKTLASTVRISYMVLPPALAREFYERLSFYACTVSSFEQYTLAKFISEGYFEKHINRMRLAYSRLRKQLLQLLRECPVADRLTVLERDSGLHFLLKIDTEQTDAELLGALAERGVHLLPLSAYYRDPTSAPAHTFILSYSALSAEQFRQALEILCEVLG